MNIATLNAQGVILVNARPTLPIGGEALVSIAGLKVDTVWTESTMLVIVSAGGDCMIGDGTEPIAIWGATVTDPTIPVNLGLLGVPCGGVFPQIPIKTTAQAGNPRTRFGQIVQGVGIFTALTIGGVTGIVTPVPPANMTITVYRVREGNT